jgi:sulfite reductase (ferredoxin)
LDAVGKDYIKALVERYKEVPSFDEDKNYYYDWGSDELFSVANKGPAECSAGLFDMIDVDLNFIKEGFKLLNEEKDARKINRILIDILFSSSRMLLVTKGAEPKTFAESFEFFIEKFINEGLVSDSFRNLLETAKTKPNQDFSARKKEIIDLANTVIKLYEGMDDSLQFKNQVNKPVEVIEEKPLKQESTTSDIRVKDFRGVPCPLNFVKTKIELATLKSGDLLEVWLDDGQPIQNVPGSVRNEGHEIKSTIQEGDFWKVLIKKSA